MKELRVVGALSCGLGLLSCAPVLPDNYELDHGDAGVTQVVVHVTAGDTGTSAMPVTFSSLSAPFSLHLEVRGSDGAVRSNFSGYVELSVHPGELGDLQGLNGTAVAGRLVQLNAGVGDVQLRLANSFGETRVWATENGYVPVSPERTTLPQCANGIDDDGDGRTDFPADYGCAAPNDDSEVGGSDAIGASEPIYFSAPALVDVNGVAPQSPLVSQRVTVTRGTMIVTRVNDSGFWVTDVDPTTAPGADHPGASLFVFNFSTPAGLRTCDQIGQLQGTVQEFVSTTQLTEPSWIVAPAGLWIDSMHPGPCQIPAPHEVTPDMIPTRSAATQVLLEPWEDGLVRITNVNLAANFGPANPMCTPADPGDPMSVGVCAFAPGSSNCDYSGDGTVDFSNAAEGLCANLCQTTVGCSEWTNWVRFNQYSVDFAVGQPSNVQRLSITPRSAYSNFDPRQIPTNLLTPLTITGTLTQVGPSWVVEPRCTEDVVPGSMVPGAAPPPATNATCITPRSEDVGP